MNILYFLIGSSLCMAVVFLAAFFWASKTGQHDDMDTPQIRMLLDDTPLHKAADSAREDEENDEDQF
jgi:cbb3-type cytochrome oxidase maturation protein